MAVICPGGDGLLQVFSNDMIHTDWSLNDQSNLPGPEFENHCALAPKGARPSSGTVNWKNLRVFFLTVIPYHHYLYWMRDVIQNGRRDMAKSNGTSSVKSSRLFHNLFAQTSKGPVCQRPWWKIPPVM